MTNGRCTGHCYCHAGPDGLMHPPCCDDCAGQTADALSPVGKAYTKGWLDGGRATADAIRALPPEVSCAWCGAALPDADAAKAHVLDSCPKSLRADPARWAGLSVEDVRALVAQWERKRDGLRALFIDPADAAGDGMICALRDCAAELAEAIGDACPDLARAREAAKRNHPQPCGCANCSATLASEPQP